MNSVKAVLATAFFLVTGLPFHATLISVKIFSSKKLFWLSGILLILSQSVIMMILFPTPASEILNHQTTYSPDEFQAILSLWGPDGLQRFLNHYYLDLLHPFIYFAFLACCLSQVWPKKYWLLVFPLVAAVSDEIENLCHLPITLGWLPVNSAWFYVGATSARMKWFFIGMTAVIVLAGLIRKLASKSPN